MGYGVSISQVQNYKNSNIKIDILKELGVSKYNDKKKFANFEFKIRFFLGMHVSSLYTRSMSLDKISSLPHHTFR